MQIYIQVCAIRSKEKDKNISFCAKLNVISKKCNEQRRRWCKY